jgi:hypothetical protein
MQNTSRNNCPPFEDIRRFTLSTISRKTCTGQILKESSRMAISNTEKKRKN